VRCTRCNRREGIAVPVMLVPIRNWPIPAYVQFKGALCQQCANTFTPAWFTSMERDWYTAVCDHLRSIAKPATNPFPGDSSFKWEEFIIKPGWEPAPEEECILQFWSVKSLEAKGAHQHIGPRSYL